MGRYGKGIQLFGFENFNCAGFGSEVDGIDKKQISWGFFNNRLDIIFRHSTCIYYISGNLCTPKMFANNGTDGIVTFKYIADSCDNSRGTTKFIKKLNFRISISLMQLTV